jgi:hypothetical protein
VPFSIRRQRWEFTVRIKRRLEPAEKRVGGGVVRDFCWEGIFSKKGGAAADAIGGGSDAIDIHFQPGAGENDAEDRIDQVRLQP